MWHSDGTTSSVYTPLGHMLNMVPILSSCTKNTSHPGKEVRLGKDTWLVWSAEPESGRPGVQAQMWSWVPNDTSDPCGSLSFRQKYQGHKIVK